MSRPILNAGLWAVLLALLAGAAYGAEEASTWGKYQVMGQRSIFSKDRGRRTESPRPRPTVSAAPRPPQRRIALTGIVRLGDEFVAFLEDSVSGATTIARVGDPVGGGVLKSVAIDQLEYETDGQTAVVKVGENLGGGAATLGGGGPVEVSAEGEAGSAPAGGGGSTGSIEEQLRQRRLREEGR